MAGSWGTSSVLAKVWFKALVYGIGSVLHLQNVWVETLCLASVCSRVVEQAVLSIPLSRELV